MIAKSKAKLLANPGTITVWIAAILLVLTGSLLAQAPRSATNSYLDTELAAYFESYSTLRTIDDKVAEVTKANAAQRPREVVIEHSWVEKFVDHTFSKRPRVSPLLSSAVVNSDLIVSGTPLTAHSLPITDRTFLFTEYTVRVDRVFFDPSHTVTAGDTIVVSREGGSIAVGGVTVKAIDSNFDQFSLNVPYFFALKTIPRTRTYRAIDLWTFVIHDSLVTCASKLEAKTEFRRSLPDFISDIQVAVAQRQMRGGQK